MKWILRETGCNDIGWIQIVHDWCSGWLLCTKQLASVYKTMCQSFTLTYKYRNDHATKWNATDYKQNKLNNRS